MGVARIDNNFYVYSYNGLFESYPFNDDMYYSILEELREERLNNENVIDAN